MFQRLIVVVALLGVAVPWGAHADGSHALNESYRATITGGGVVSEGIGLATRAGGPSSGSIAITGVPGPAQVLKAFLYWAVIAGDDSAVSFGGSNVQGALIGRSHDTCWFDIRNPDPANDNRVYRADVTSHVTGNGNYSIAGVGDVGGLADGQGASLVVIYDDPTDETKTTVVINDGALTGGFPGPNSAHISHNFNTGSLGSGATSARLHAGVGDTSATFPDGGMKLGGSPVLPSFDGSDGGLWDDVTVPVAPALLGGSTQNTISVGDDCLVWTYAALEVRAPASSLAFTEPAPNAMTRADVRFAGTAGAAVKSVRLTDGGNVLGTIPVTGTWSTTFRLSEGWHNVRAEGLDQNGAPLGVSADVNFRVDTRAPRVSVSSPRVASVEIGNFDVRGDASDDASLSRVVISWRELVSGDEGETVAACPACGGTSSNWSAELSLDDGAYAIFATAYDAAGNSTKTPLPVAVVHIA